MKKELLCLIPSVQEILKDFEIKSFPLDETSKRFVINQTLLEIRNEIINEKIALINFDEIISKIKKQLNQKKYSLTKVFNATGVILHTNLGRSILPSESILNFIEVNSGYSNVEYDLTTKKRGNRENHLKDLLIELTGCEDVCIVNNNASAVFLVINTLAKSKKVIVSRGENIEIGGSFRIPEIIKASGAKIIDVGTTNKTYFEDYKNALELTSAKIILKIHKSNYDILGFTHSTSIAELSKLKKANTYLVEDQGSGSLFDLTKYNQKLTKENTVKQSIIDGADLVLFSGDKLLGSIQAGIIVGRKELISRIKKNQLFRMLRTSKVVTSILEATLSVYKNKELAIKNIPTLRMICESPKEVEKRINSFLKIINNPNIRFDKIEVKSTIGGGSLPGDEIDSFGLAVKHINKSDKELVEWLHNLSTPIICKTNNKKVIMDFKTIQENEIEKIAEVINNEQL